MRFKTVSVDEHMRLLKQRRERIGPDVISWRQLALFFPPLTRYQQYLCSVEWAAKREAVSQRCGDICERCRAAPMQHVHHLTYEHLYHEPLDELVGLCARCHAMVHGKPPPESAGQADHPSEM